MKSLEILENETIANIFLDTAEEFIKDITKGLEINKEAKEDIQIICNIISEFGSRVADKIQKSLFPIKKDLEILEILQVLILHNGKSVGYKGIISDFEVMFRLGKITKEQLDKIKQWLEEND